MLEGSLAAYEDAPEAVSTWQETSVETYEEAPEMASSWQEAPPEAVERPESVPAQRPVDALSPSSWPVHAPASLEVPDAASEIRSEDVSQEITAPAMPEPVANVAPELAAPSAPSITIFGRVQMTISPVPDFDKLLSLDSALARIPGVHSVTLADYAREEVIFRVELERPVSVVDFSSQLSDTAGVPTEVTEASESTLSIRIS